MFFQIETPALSWDETLVELQMISVLQDGIISDGAARGVAMHWGNRGFEHLQALGEGKPVWRDDFENDLRSALRPSSWVPKEDRIANYTLAYLGLWAGNQIIRHRANPEG